MTGLYTRVAQCPRCFKPMTRIGRERRSGIAWRCKGGCGHRTVETDGTRRATRALGHRRPMCCGRPVWCFGSPEREMFRCPKCLQYIYKRRPGVSTPECCGMGMWCQVKAGKVVAYVCHECDERIGVEEAPGK